MLLPTLLAGRAPQHAPDGARHRAEGGRARALPGRGAARRHRGLGLLRLLARPRANFASRSLRRALLMLTLCPGHSIAVARALKSSPWAAAGGKWG